VTTLSNYTVVAENRVTIKPKKMSFKVAALYGCAVLTGAGMVFKQAKPKKNDKVLIIGMGAVGVSALLALKSLKIKNITIVDKNKKRLKLLEKLNVNRIRSLNEFKKKITSKEFKDFDICFECAGTTKTIELGFSRLKKNSGKLFFASHPNTKSKIKLDPYDLICGKKIFGSWGGQTTPSKDLKKIFNTFEKNKIKLDFLITRVYYLNNINKVVSDFKEGKVLKPIIKMSH
jgi:S-(hydroxymethyl)glutathione dehydrogenase/alcohol dehydrogenase